MEDKAQEGNMVDLNIQMLQLDLQKELPLLLRESEDYMGRSLPCIKDNSVRSSLLEVTPMAAASSTGASGGGRHFCAGAEAEKELLGLLGSLQIVHHLELEHESEGWYGLNHRYDCLFFWYFECQ